jgi:hypothetical protein
MNDLCEGCGLELCGHGYCLRCEGCDHHEHDNPQRGGEDNISYPSDDEEER